MPTNTVEKTESLEQWRQKYNDFVTQYSDFSTTFDEFSTLFETVGLQKTSETGSAAIPSGTTGERDSGSPLESGYLRFNTDLKVYDFYDGIVWRNLPSIQAHFDSLPISSTTFNSGSITEIIYTTGNKVTFTYTGSTKIEIKYYAVNGTTLITTNTINFDGSGNLSTTTWT